MTDFIKGPNEKIAYEYSEGNSGLPPIIFLCGFKSDMGGTKAEWLADYCRANNRTYLRFDYFAHGQSKGDFKDFTIGKAVDDALFMLDEFIIRPALVIGSSMGGWVGLRLLEQRVKTDIYGFIGLAAAPDFTTEIKSRLSDTQKKDLAEKGFFEEPSDYGEPYVFTHALLEDGEVHCMLNKTILTDRPIALIQGKQDKSVEWGKAHRINDMVSGVASIHFIEDGDHSLSRPQDLKLLQNVIEEIS